MKHNKEWITLQLALGQGELLQPLIDEFGGAKEILALNEAQRMVSALFTPAQSKKLDSVNEQEVEQIMRLCEKNQWQIITYEDSDYPEILRNIIDPPAVLYCWGTLPDLSQTLSIGMVGSRVATNYALRATDYLSVSIAGCGGIIISGGAKGVDSASHLAALRVGAPTIAVLGNGFGANYLMNYEAMRQNITKNGALLTEYPPFVAANAYHFPLRNRLISALSDGVVVVEAALKSGSLITARRANEQGKDVFAIPGSIISQSYAGTNKLLQDGAIPVLSPDSILGYYQHLYPSLDLSRLITLNEWQASMGEPSAILPPVTRIKAPKQSFYLDEVDVQKVEIQKRAKAAEALSPALRVVYDSFTQDYQHIDAIINQTGMSGSLVISAVTQLELLGLISATAGKRYRKE